MKIARQADDSSEGDCHDQGVPLLVHEKENKMARRNDGEVEELAGGEEEFAGAVATEEKPKKAPKEPKRGQLPDGYGTPNDLAKVLTERQLHTAKDGSHEVKTQMVYSYMNNAPESDPFPIQEVTDSLGNPRKALVIEEGVAWWIRKNERAGARKANAAEKAAKKAAAAEAKANGETAEVAEVVEAE